MTHRIILAFLLAFGLTYFVCEVANAECVTVSPTVFKCGERLTLQPAFAASAGQLNLADWRDKGFDAAYQRIALMTGYGFTYHGAGMTIGASIYVGMGLSANRPDAPQASLLVTLWDFLAFGPGVQTFERSDGQRIYQMLLTLAVNYQAGATTNTFLETVGRVVQACIGAACQVK